MKVCNDKPQKRQTTYTQLKSGDVFTLPDSDLVWLKVDNGHVGLDAGMFFNSYWGDIVVIRYPNACLTLGEPE